MDILVTLPRSKKGSRFITVMTGRYSKLTRAISSTKTTAPQALIYLDHWVIPFGISLYVLTENGLQSTSRIFAFLGAFLRPKLLSTTVYRSQTNEQTGRYNGTVVGRIRYYVKELQTEWDDYVLPLTRGYSFRGHRTTDTISFSRESSRKLPRPINVILSSSVREQGNGLLTLRQLKAKLLGKVRLLTSKADGRARRVRTS